MISGAVVDHRVFETLVAFQVVLVETGLAGGLGRVDFAVGHSSRGFTEAVDGHFPVSAFVAGEFAVAFAVGFAVGNVDPAFFQVQSESVSTHAFGTSVGNLTQSRAVGDAGEGPGDASVSIFVVIRLANFALAVDCSRIGGAVEHLLGSVGDALGFGGIQIKFVVALGTNVRTGILDAIGDFDKGIFYALFV